ncbi:MAG: TolC family protein [Myxococcaceae bacterium]
MRFSIFILAVTSLLATGALAQSADAGTDALLPAPRQFQPKLDDPMLQPAPRPKHELANWQQAMDLVRANSTDLRSAEAGVLRAEGRWKQSLSSLLPNLRFTAQGSMDALHPDNPPIVAGALAATADGTVKLTHPVVGSAAISANQTLFDLTAWNGMSSSRASQQSAEAQLEDAKRRVTQGLARSLVAVLAAERAAELNRLGLRLALERAALTQRTYELGAGTQLDVVRGEQDVAVARGALVSGDEQLRRTREALGVAVGVNDEVGILPGFAMDGLVAEAQRSCTAQPGVENRSDVVAARKQVEAASKNTEQASAGYLPSVGLSSTLLGVTTDPGFGRVATWNISAVLTVPIWEGGLREGLVRERRGIEEQTVQSAELTVRSVSFEVARARRGVEVAEELFKSAKDARDLARRSDELTRKSFEIGRSTSLELVQSAIVLRQAELTLALREYELVQARLDALMTEARCEG